MLVPRERGGRGGFFQYQVPPLRSSYAMWSLGQHLHTRLFRAPHLHIDHRSWCGSALRIVILVWDGSIIARKGVGAYPFRQDGTAANIGRSPSAATLTSAKCDAPSEPCGSNQAAGSHRCQRCPRGARISAGGRKGCVQPSDGEVRILAPVAWSRCHRLGYTRDNQLQQRGLTRTTYR